LASTTKGRGKRKSKRPSVRSHLRPWARDALGIGLVVLALLAILGLWFGSAGPVTGGATNDLFPISGEPNVTIMEAKACGCNIVPGRLPRGPAFEDWLNKYVPQGGPPNLHPEQPPPGVRPGAPGGGHAEHGKIDTR